jgi:uncharacterized protein Yka (UPF0111/DUF47 family)
MSETVQDRKPDLVANFSLNDARFMMLAASHAAMIISGNVDMVAEMREHLLRFGARSGYSTGEMTHVIAKMRQLVEVTAELMIPALE